MPLDPTKVKVVSSFKYDGTFRALCQEADSGRLLAGGDDAAIHIFDPAQKKTDAVARWTKHDGYISALVALKQGGKSVVVSGSYDRQLIWWDAAAGKPLRSVEAHQGWIRHVVATPDSSRLISVGDDMLVKVWDAASGKLIRSLAGHALRTPQGHVTALYAVAVHPGGKIVASGDRHGEVRVWDTDTGKLLTTFQVPTLYTYDPRQRKRSIGGIRTLAFSPDGNLLAAGGVGQIGNVDGLGGPIHMELWDWRKPEARVVAGGKRQNGIINHLLFHPEGDWLIGGGGANGFLAFWKIKPLPPPSPLPLSPRGRGEGVRGRATIPDHHLKFDGHAHRLVLNVARKQLYAAGYRKLDVWALG